MGRTAGTSAEGTAAECRSGDELSGSGLVFRALGVMSFLLSMGRTAGTSAERTAAECRSGDELSESGLVFRALACILFFIGRVCPGFNGTYTMLASVCSLIFYRKLTPTFWVCLVADKSNGFVRLHEYK
ncbi:MAG: hypothetical protein QY309_13065 [Cyclobacteriaceae bacterium]|nr:MAG: hypothetical protein QY309_13065 [Cyclobacteriaceae bacterium]